MHTCLHHTCIYVSHTQVLRWYWGGELQCTRPILYIRIYYTCIYVYIIVYICTKYVYTGVHFFLYMCHALTRMHTCHTLTHTGIMCRLCGQHMNNKHAYTYTSMCFLTCMYTFHTHVYIYHHTHTSGIDVGGQWSHDQYTHIHICVYTHILICVYVFVIYIQVRL